MSSNDIATTTEMDDGTRAEDSAAFVPPSAIDRATSFVREHPGIAVAGGLAAGVLAAALLRSKTRGKLMRSASDFAEIAAAAGLAFGRQAMERAEDTGEELRRRGSQIADRAEVLGGAVKERASHALEPAGRTARSASHRIARMALDLHSRLKP